MNIRELQFRIALLLGFVRPVRADIERMRREAIARDQRVAQWRRMELERIELLGRLQQAASDAAARALLYRYYAELRARADHDEMHRAYYAETLLQIRGMAPDTLSAIERCGKGGAA